ncbi:unnamed protein product [Thlaspi arvense]|uniref:DUF4216 domain-containing protein n=1 Tax=Thlaspi arvense TaxID=13288 RepID=A0AAU9SIK0_THLAR|nr:unnamed protein product [Thlaspi arvense]
MCQVSGKSTTRWLTNEDYTVLQTFMLLNCDTFAPYERIIKKATQSYEFPMWMLDFVQGPRRNYTSWHIYLLREYRFHTHAHGQNKKTLHYDVYVKGTTDADYYGLIEDIMMIEYHGAVGLKAMIFKCKWFSTTEGCGFHKHPSSIVDVSPHRRCEKYDPVILSGNCNQTCFIAYLHVRRSSSDWWACTKVMPREFLALQAVQDDTRNQVVAASAMIRIESHVMEDASNYDMQHVCPPNDEYISEDELENSANDYDSDTDSDYGSD